MISKALISLLQGLDLYKNSSVFFLNEDEGKTFAFKNKEIKRRLTEIEPTAFYIFNNQPLILFFDLSENNNAEKEKQIHKKVWSFDQSPIIFIVKANKVKIFNAFSYSKKKEQLEEMNISEEERNKKFSFWNLQSGNTWRWLQTEYYENKNIQKKRVNQILFENIKFVREKLTNPNTTNKLSEDQANTLVLRLIFIRYLIDRGVKIDETYIEGKELNEKRKSLVELIEKPRKLNAFFKELNIRFNGVLFKDIKFELSKEQAKDLSDVFKGEKVEKHNLFYGIEPYFEIFDFSIIPVELISGIYESLISKETQKLNSAVYTPSYLVEYILNNTVDVFFDKNKSKSTVKIFDPAVGSGIFLVQSFRRMVDKEIELTQNETVKKSRLKEIIEQNIFGIDVSLQALNVTCFSLYIAILDYQSPSTILDKFHFPTLIGENLFRRSFFKKDKNFDDFLLNKNIDFILGNPPWQNNKDKEHLDWLKQNNLIEIVSDFQIAQSYILRTKEFSSQGTKCCFIITSKAIYNNNAKDFRKYFLENYFLSNCMDLSPVRHLIFKGADNPAMILNFDYAFKKNTKENVVVHNSLKHNIFIKYFNTLVFEKFDLKTIKQKYFAENNWMFKVALYGGVLDYQLIKKFSKWNVANFLSSKNIIEGNGIKKGTPKRHFDFLIGMPIVETKQIKLYYTKIKSDFKVLSKKDVFLEAGREIGLFNGKKIILGKRTKNETEINVSLVNETCAFRDSANAVSFNQENEEYYHILFAFFISNLHTYYQYLTSANWGVYYPEINKSEYLSFPFIEPSENQKRKLNILTDKFIQPYITFQNQFNLGVPEKDIQTFNEINAVIESVYKVEGYEKDLIDYTLKIARYQFQDGKDKQKLITDFTYLDEEDYRNRDKVLNSYADVFIEQFKDLYKDEYLQVEVYALDYFIAMSFVFKKEKPKQKIVFNNNETDEKKVLKAISKSITIEKVSDKIFIQKDCIGFEENSFYIIKPNEYKCWHRAMAWYDVSEIKKTIEEAEIDYLKDSFND